MAASALAIEDVVKSFPVPQTGVRAFLNPFSPLTHPALLGVTFQVEPGEIAALIGANGSGKSTLLRILATLLVPTRGSARVSGYDIERQGPLVRAQLGFHSATDGGFFDRLTARENLQFFAAMNNLFDAKAAARLEELTDLMGMGTFIDSQVRTLSTGQVHRLGLARAMIHRPSVLLLDEPTRSLDPIAAADFRRFLKTQPGRTPRHHHPVRIAHAGGSRTTGGPRRAPRQGTHAGMRFPTRPACRHRRAYARGSAGAADSSRFAGRGVLVNSQRMWRKVLAFFRRDVAIARSYRMAFGLEILEAFFGVATSTTSRASFRTTNSRERFPRAAIISPSPWSASPSSTI